LVAFAVEAEFELDAAVWARLADDGRNLVGVEAADGNEPARCYAARAR
jgi:hypothetical protein